MADATPTTIRIGRAREQGLSLAGPWQLLDATLMYAPPDVRVLLDRCDTPAYRLQSAAQKIEAFGKPPWAYAPAIGLLQYGAGIPAAPDKPIIESVARQLKSVAVLTGGSPMLAVLQFEATRQTIRLGHPNTTTAHVVLAIASFYEQTQLAADRSGLAPYAAAGQVLAECGVDVIRAAHRLPTDVELRLAPITRSLQIAPGKRPPWTTAARSVLDAAIRTSHGRPLETHATHLLIAALVDAKLAASQMLDRIEGRPGRPGATSSCVWDATRSTASPASISVRVPTTKALMPNGRMLCHWSSIRRDSRFTSPGERWPATGIQYRSPSCSTSAWRLHSDRPTPR